MHILKGMTENVMPPMEMVFQQVRGAYDALWSIGGRIAVAREASGASTNWLRNYSGTLPASDWPDS